MMVSWSSKLQDELGVQIRRTIPEVVMATEGKEKYWYVTKQGHRYMCSLAFGKYAAIPEFSVRFTKSKEGGQYHLTSPQAKVFVFTPKWKDVKKLSMLSDKTRKIKDKTILIYWLLSPTKDWVFVCTDEQLASAKDNIIPEAVRQYGRMIRRR